MRNILSGQPRFALSAMQVALVVFAHGKASASGNSLGNAAIIPPQFDGLQQKSVVHEVLVQETDQARESGKEIFESALSVFEDLAEAAETSATQFDYFFQQPMGYEHLKLWLQCYNAGPYATLKYKGNVPYRETRNYTPRVLKYYRQDLSNSPYDSYIVASARKYGLDPQMVRAIIKTESDFRNSCVSHAGARGLMQVMPCVWSEVKKRYDLNWEYRRGVFKPEQNIEVACAYLAWLRYDFLPKKFADFDPNPVTPPMLVRDNKLKHAANRVVLGAAKSILPTKEVHVANSARGLADQIQITFNKANNVKLGDESTTPTVKVELVPAKRTALARKSRRPRS